MKKFAFLSFIAIVSCISLYAQAPDYRFGKVSEQELRMETYDQDPDAEAVILYEDVFVYYQFTSTADRMTEYRIRIKVLKAEGVTVANVQIPFQDHARLRESVSSIDAAAYNLENGKIVKTPLKKQYVFREQLSDSHSCYKFSIPEVRAGTVIEYRYRHMSGNDTYLPPFVIQHEYPVVKSTMLAVIPEFYKFSLNMKGAVRIALRESSSTGTLPSSGGTPYTFNNREIHIEGKDIPALKDEPYIWNLDDFRSMLEFELSQIAYPNSLIQTFSSTWESVNATLAKSSFDEHTRIGNPFKDEVAAIKAKGKSPLETAHDVLKLVQSKITWNKEYRLFAENPRAAAGRGVGSSADINFVLIAALKDAGFNVTPILLSPRHAGRLPYTHATINGIHAFVVRIALDPLTYVYADGTDPNSDINLLPLTLQVDRARIYGIGGEGGWCDLSTLTPNTKIISLNLKAGKEGTFVGMLSEEHTNSAALETSTDYTEAKSHEEYIEKLEKEHGIRIDSLQIDGVGTPRVRQNCRVSLTPTYSEEHIYLDATFLPFMTINPLTAQSRMLPVEFPNAMGYNLHGTIFLPVGYTVEEMPKNIAMSACENGVRCRYVVQAVDNTIQFAFQLSFNRLIFLPTEYDDIKAFFGHIIDLNNNQIVIRKIVVR